METPHSFATREEFWRLQETLSEISTVQLQHSERIMRLEKRRDEDVRVKNVWGPASPFTTVLGSSAQPESTLNPTAEAFRNFDTEPSSGLMSSLTLDNPDDARRGVASRANSVRFDESANNHYRPSSRQSIDLPPRTGSGLGSHPLSERSLSHRSDGRSSTSGFPPRTNSFGLESSRLLGSINNSPRVSGNPPPGFFILGPFPAIIRCWLTEEFSHASLLYAAVCTGSYVSFIGLPLLQQLGLSDEIFEEQGLRKIKLSLYLTEAKIQHASSRSASPIPQVPTLTFKFVVNDSPVQDSAIQVILGSDVLRSHSADLLFSQDKLFIFDEDRNQLTVPLVRPESESVYKYLATTSVNRGAASENASSTPEPVTAPSPPGIIGRPNRSITLQTPTSPPMSSASILTSAAASEIGDPRKAEQNPEGTSRSSAELGRTKTSDDTKSTTGSESSFTAPAVGKPHPGVWGSSWRATSGSTQTETSTNVKNASNYSRPAPPRNMKILRPGKTPATGSRTASTTAMPANGPESAPSRSSELDRRTSQTSSTGEHKPTLKPNPIGSGSAFGWLNSGQQRRTLANGE